ncbi:iron-containing alcohol dehydrogenase [Klebsiella pneumoniae]|nr:iron-containing alcohol dehydrogenase [Klebsiella pneumoniae]
MGTICGGRRADGLWPVSGGHGVQQRRSRAGTCLAHQPGATHNLPHGVCNAILLPIIENFNRPNAVARFARVAQAMGVDTRGMSDEAASMEAINAIRTLSKRVGIPQGFSQLGVSKADIEGWLDKALADPCAPCNPRPASRDEVRELYLEAL